MSENENTEYQISISEDAVRKGIPGDPSNCAIAKEVKRQHPDLTYITVGRKTIAATDRASGLRFLWRTPFTVEEAVDRFDSDGFAAFPDFHLLKSEARTKPISFNSDVRAKQNQRRAAMRSGEHVPVAYSEAQKNAKRARRRMS